MPSQPHSLFDPLSPPEVPSMFETLVYLEEEIGKTEREFWHSCTYYTVTSLWRLAVIKAVRTAHVSQCRNRFL